MEQQDQNPTIRLTLKASDVDNICQAMNYACQGLKNMQQAAALVDLQRNIAEQTKQQFQLDAERARTKSPLEAAAEMVAEREQYLDEIKPGGSA